ncbi:hypothetical protein ACIQUU_26710 [Streptomyces sp. NPDC101116]|uniref:hypothetical protein n=1 Tax=Streptomyces sp. NPDC101116 TaxID=3366107 RepID=UPI0037F2AAD5
MTGHDVRTTAPGVLVRSDGEVDEDTLAYAREKIDAVIGRPGVPALTGEVRIAKAAAHHVDRPWSATASLHVGRREVVVLAEEGTGREVVDRLQDRLRRRLDKAAHTGHDGHRTPAPPWRGGAGTPAPAEDSGTATDSHRA